MSSYYSNSPQSPVYSSSRHHRSPSHAPYPERPSSSSRRQQQEVAYMNEQSMMRPMGADPYYPQGSYIQQQPQSPSTMLPPSRPQTVQGYASPFPTATATASRSRQAAYSTPYPAYPGDTDAYGSPEPLYAQPPSMHGQRPRRTSTMQAPPMSPADVQAQASYATRAPLPLSGSVVPTSSSHSSSSGTARKSSSTSAAVATDNTERPPVRHSCPQCDQTFTRAHDMRRHFSTAHAESPHKDRCSWCGREFSRGDSLKRHRDTGCPNPPPGM